jgi:hypothetical protein
MLFRYRMLTHVRLSRPSHLLSLATNRTSRLQVTRCPRSRPERSSATAVSPTGGITHVPRRQAAPATMKRSAASPREPARESQALRSLSLSAVRLGRSLRSRSRASPMHEVRQRTAGKLEARPTQDRQEPEMHNGPQYHCNGAAKRCAICDGRFGLIRYYSWRTALCSKKCADRFKDRQDGDRRWLRRLQAA